MRALAAALLAALGALLAAPGADAQPAPYRRYRTLETPHFLVHVADGLEREGRVAAAAAERAYAQLARELAPPRGTIDLVVSDDADYANGYASPLPGNRIVVFATPPVESPGLRFSDDWLALVVTHELAHVFHLDRARGVWSVAQRVFGRAPYLFPNLYGPAWLTEGLAVYYESRLTDGGRLKEAQSRSLARASALEGRFPRLDELSLSSPRFPGGDASYGYGALFVDHLARTRGDSSVGRFVERQSALLLPLWVDRAAVQGFGVSFSRAYGRWRDSAQRSAGLSPAPLAGWRELTTHGYYASNPRWVDDSTIVYVGTDGRETNAAYAITTSGVRTRVGRRDGRGANVPLAGGGFLYAGMDYVGAEEVRSDLYRERGGRSVRLTRGARLVQPDARRDGAIVAVRLGPARSDLVLLDSLARGQRVLREAGPDESWSEPRWSPDGRRIAAVRRRHGGEFALEVLELERDTAYVLDRGRYVIASPSWFGDRVVYTTEEGGAPRLAFAAPGGRERARGGVNEAPALYTPERSPDGRHVAVVVLRADGYHVGVAPAPAAPDSLVPLATLRPTASSVDTQPLAAGALRAYSPWRSLAPRYWFPVIEPGPVGGSLFGLSTSGFDVVGRHFYSASAAVPVDGRFAVGGAYYRYAGMRRPYLDLGFSQDWTSLSALRDASGALVGTLLRRTQDLSLAASFVRPRVRTFSSLSAGVGVERRRFAADPEALIARVDSSFRRGYDFPRAFVSASWSNVQRPPLSISPEDGVTLGVTVRERLRADAPSRTASTSVTGAATGFKSLDLPGFAHHVLALRLAGGLADRRAGTAFEVGGTSGSTVQVVTGYSVGEGRRTFGVRGFPVASTFGTAAAAGSLEYRAPVVLGGRGFGLLPLFFDRSSLSVFADAGVATCHAAPLYPSTCAPSPLIGRTIASAGGELSLSAAILEWDAPQTLRFGVALPVAGRALVGDEGRSVRRVSPYLAFGLSF